MAPTGTQLADAMGSAADALRDNSTLALLGGAGALAAAFYVYQRRGDGYRRTPSSFEISGGAVAPGKVKETVRGAGGGARGARSLAGDRGSGRGSRGRWRASRSACARAWGGWGRLARGGAGLSPPP